MATNIKGPGIYLAQFGGDEAPFNSWDAITRWAAGHGFKGVQLPSWDGRLIDLKKAASSKTYCDELAGVARENGVEITELGTHLQGQLVAVHPAYDEAFDAFAPEAVRGHPKQRQKWAVEQMLLGGQGVEASGPEVQRQLSRGAGLAVPLSVAAAPAGPDRDRVRRARQTLAADLRRVRRGRLQRRLRAASGRGPVRRRHLRDVPRAGGQPSALLHQLRPVALPAAAARLPRVHRHLSRAHHVAARQGRGVPARRASRACTRATSRGCSGQDGSARSATARSTSARIFSKMAQYGYDELGGAGVGVLPEAPAKPARPRAPSSSSGTSSASPSKAFDDFAGGKADPKQARRMLGLLGDGQRPVTIEAKKLRRAIKPVDRIRRSAWSGAARAPSSAACIASPPGSTISTSWWPARSRPSAEKARRSGLALGLAEDRCYADYTAMAKAEAARGDGIEAVAIVTPNHLHAPVAEAFLEGRHPRHLRQAADDDGRRRRAGLEALAAKHRRIFAVTYNYTGYPMVREARQRVRDGLLGEIRVVQVEYAQDWLTESLEATGQKQAEWRTDPARSGAGGCVGDIGTHAFQLAGYVPDSKSASSAPSSAPSSPAGASTTTSRCCCASATARAVRSGPARSRPATRTTCACASMAAAPGSSGARSSRTSCSGRRSASRRRRSRAPPAPPGPPRRGCRASRPATPRATSEAFATLYGEIAQAIRAARPGAAKVDPAVQFPGLEDGRRGVEFIEATVASSARGGRWVRLGR